MNAVKMLIAMAALSASSLVMAEGGGERTVARMEQARQEALPVYPLAQRQEAVAPAVEAPAANNKTPMADHRDC
ncbi:MAG: hypothetical protein A3I66_16235 [Burkholderiales bacterium RIFCSPLOWO2_02_FULL_57_36]|nr:MAG: hypothetical protein A3I66_16235 [Burkholderiales bacterium RIFCSPLOWO2_02_FULL_57_36]